MSLRDYHDALNEWAKSQERERKSTISRYRARDRIHELTARIDAHRRRREDEALAAMSAQWPITRATIEACPGLAPETRDTWLKWFDGIRYSSNRANSAQLDAMAVDVNAVAGRLAEIACDLRRAADARKSSSLATWLPPWARSRSLLDPSWPAPRARPWTRVQRLQALAPDLRPIRDRIIGVDLAGDVRAQLLGQLAHIDSSVDLEELSTAAERAWNLASAIECLQDSVRAIASSMTDQAIKCRSYWEA